MHYPLLTGGAGTYCTHQHSISTSDRQTDRVELPSSSSLRHARPAAPHPPLGPIQCDRPSLAARYSNCDLPTYRPCLPTYPFQPSKVAMPSGKSQGREKGREKVEYAQASNSTGGSFLFAQHFSLCLSVCCGEEVQWLCLQSYFRPAWEYELFPNVHTIHNFLPVQILLTRS